MVCVRVKARSRWSVLASCFAISCASTQVEPGSDSTGITTAFGGATSDAQVSKAGTGGAPSSSGGSGTTATPPKATAVQLACFASASPTAGYGCEVDRCFRSSDAGGRCTAGYTAMMCDQAPDNAFPANCYPNHSFDGSKTGWCCQPVK